MSAGVYLESYLAPLAPWLGREDVADVLVNRPGEVWIETIAGVMSRAEAPELSEQILGRLARQIAAASHQAVNGEQPLLAARLPSGARVQIAASPATRAGLVLAVRKHAIADLSLTDMAASGLFAAPAAPRKGRAAATDDDLARLAARGDHQAFLSAAVLARKTIVISGGTSSGKTTLLNALVKEIGAEERLIAIEDTAEIRLVHPNSVGLIAARSPLGEALVDADDLLAAALRLRPDRILLGELRGREAFSFLRAVNSGHPGSITTVHADHPAGALDQIALLAMTSGVDLGWDKLRAYIGQVADVVVQLERTAGIRRVSEIAFQPRARRSPASGG